MKKIFLFIAMLSILITGCSNVNKDAVNSIEKVVSGFFSDTSNIELTDNPQVESLQSYFTLDSDVKEGLVEYFMVSLPERQKEVLVYVGDVTKVELVEGMYKTEVNVDVTSKEKDTVLFQTRLNLYLEDEDGQMKIKTADYGG